MAGSWELIEKVQCYSDHKARCKMYAVWECPVFHTASFTGMSEGAVESATLGTELLHKEMQLMSGGTLCCKHKLQGKIPVLYG